MPRRSHHIDQVVGLRIAARRSALGWSQSALARALGVSFQQVQKYEAGANRISASRLHQAAAAMACSIADFFRARPDAEGSEPLVHPVMASAEGRRSEERRVGAE